MRGITWSRGSTWRLLSAKVRRRRGEERGPEQRKRGPISSLFQPNAMPPPEKRREGKGGRDVQVNQLVGRSRGGRSILDRTRFIFASSALEAMKQVPTHTGARTEQARKQGGTEKVSNSGVSFDRGQGKRRTSKESSVGGLELLDRALERGGRRSERGGGEATAVSPCVRLTKRTRATDSLVELDERESVVERAGDPGGHRC